MRVGFVMAAWILLLVPGLQVRGDFLATLSPEQARQLGLDRLTAEQAVAVDAAIEAYTKTHTAAAAQQAAAAAVIDYKAKQEPGVIERALSVFKTNEAVEKRELFTTKIIGRFTGWGGSTRFALENGQVWQQIGSEVYYISPVENPEVEFRKAHSGYFRLYLPDGTWVTVKRIR